MYLINNLAHIIQKKIPGPDCEIPIVLIQPVEEAAEGLYPVVLNIHGGGMFMGSAEAECGSMIPMAKELKCIFVSPEYRLAPEDPYPAQVTDCYATLLWIAENIREYHGDPSKIIVMGGSAGSGLAAAMTLKARDENGPRIAYQCLLYPMIDDRLTNPSTLEITDSRISCRAACIGMWDMYLKNLPKEDIPVYAAPARVEDFTGLPPAFLAVGQLEPFRDETIYYAQQLMYAGIPTELHVFPGCFHAWDAYAPGSDVAAQLNKLKIQALSKALEW